MNLLLPNGRVYRHETISEAEMVWLSEGEHMCRKLQTTIICTRCKQTLQGQNDEADTTISVTCGCGKKTFQRAVSSASAN